MIEITFDITIDEADSHDEPLLDSFEINQLLDHTRGQITRHVQQSLGDLRCDIHDEPARVHINGCYSLQTEQLDINYDVNACCKLFLLRAIAALNRG